ncbi:TPA: hypothetical protein L4V00_000197 [Pseudomonas aeruginosa]|nr:hypothetical protein [Pseudomonas aeruginosa]HBO4702823.1 hypothetical protein [Pseudomonas aeruginosa]
MDLSDAISATSSIIYGEGDPMLGCELSVEQARAWLSAMEPPRPFCLIADWCWLDLEASSEANAESHVQSASAFVYGGSVLFDSRFRFPVGGWVRSTKLVALREEFIFETRNTRYLLMGQGVRRMSSPGAVASIR